MSAAPRSGSKAKAQGQTHVGRVAHDYSLLKMFNYFVNLLVYEISANSDVLSIIQFSWEDKDR